MGRYYIYLLFIISGVPLDAQAQQNCGFTMQGRVIDEHDQSFLSYATIFIRESGQGVVADSTGKYHIANLCAGTYNIVVSHVSCEPVAVSVRIRGNTQKDLFLEHHVEALQDVTIAGQRLQTNTNSAQEQQLDNQQLERYSGGSLGEALKEVNGVSSLTTGKTLVKPVIQGLYGSRVLIVNHGVRMQDMEWGDEHAPNVDINAAGHVTVIKGASALRYGGDAVGGTVVIEPQVITTDTLMGKTLAQAASNGRGGSVNTELIKSTKKGWFGKIQGSLKRFGDYKAPEYLLTNTGMFEKGFSIHGGHKLDQGGFDLYYSWYDAELAILRSSHIGSIDDLVNAINSQQPLVIEDFSHALDLPRQEVTHQLGRIQYHRFINKTRLQAQYDFQFNQRFEFDIRVGDDRDKPAIDLDLTTHTLTSDISINQNGDLPLEAGLLFRYQNNFANPDTGIRRLIPDYHKNDAGGYVSGTYRISPDLFLDAGIRYDFSRIDAKKFYQTSRWNERNYQLVFAHMVIEELATQLLVNAVFDYHNISGTTGLQYQWKGRADIRFNYSLAQRAPNPAELFSDGLHQSAARIELGDLRLTGETSHKMSFSAKGQKANFHWEISPYMNFINDFILLEPSGVEQTIRGAFPVWEYRQIDARLWGLDASGRIYWDQQWSSNHRLSYVNGQDRRGNRPLINIPSPQIRNSVNFGLASWHGLELALESIYTFEQKRFPNHNFQAFLPLTDSFQEVDISTPPEAYHLFNFSSIVKFSVFNNQALELGLAIHNLLDTNYRDYLNRLRYFGDELGRNFQISLKFSY